MKLPIQSSLELGDVVRQFGAAYLQNQGEHCLPSQRKALEDIASCHTAERGGHRYRCNECDQDFWVYHGCRNRSCSSCHTQAMRDWINQREKQMLNCPYFHLIVTVPEQIRAAFLAHQKRLYGLLMTTVASCVLELAHDPRFLGATPAIMAVLHTWRGDLGLHPHVHLLVSAGGVSKDGRHWVKIRNKKWLLHVHALKKFVRNRFQARLEKSAPEVFQQIAATVWKQGWNSFIKSHGHGAKTVLNYLGRYVYRIAISNARLLAMDETHVTFRYKESKTEQWHTIRLRGEEFLRRFIMHVLPRGFHKVRYYGLWHHSQRDTRERIRLLLAPKVTCAHLAELDPNSSRARHDQNQSPPESNDPEQNPSPTACPHCKSRNVRLIESLARNRSP